MQQETITLYELNSRIAQAILNNRGTQQVWITAELSDVSNKGGHTYMELIQKDERGTQVAKARAMIWRGSAGEIDNFEKITGQSFCSGIKLKVLASATMHPVFGLSLNITRIDPTFTMGDLLIRRREILERLKREGVLEDNKSLPWPVLPLRVAIVSAQGAAGYGDFMKHIQVSGARFRFSTYLFAATMQGENTIPTVLRALSEIEDHQDKWDCVVLIRGGGATSDLASFENYDLAYRIATFPLPVIVGIGHERDVTVLDYIANVRVKTPTAAADFLVQQCNDRLDSLNRYAQTLCDIARDRIHNEILQLSYLESNNINFARNVVSRAMARLERATLLLESVNSKSILPAKHKLEAFGDKLGILAKTAVERQKTDLKALEQLIEALSPQSVLKRGYSITRINGKIITSAECSPEPGTELTTTLYNGEIKSITI